MNVYNAMISYTPTGEQSTTLVIKIEANSFNDAFIIGASKAYAMFAGTNNSINGIAITLVNNG